MGSYLELDLTPLIARYGEEWPSVSRGAYRIIEGLISKRLSRLDCFMRHGSDKYFLLFKGLTEMEARLKSNLIAEEIVSALGGPNTPLSARVAVARAIDDSPLETCKQFIEPSNRFETENVAAFASGTPDTLPKAQQQRLATLLAALGTELGKGRITNERQAEARNNRWESMIQLLRQADDLMAGRVSFTSPQSHRDSAPTSSAFLALREAIVTGLRQVETAFVESVGRAPYTSPPPRDSRIAGLPMPSSHRAQGPAPKWEENATGGNLPGWQSVGDVPPPVKGATSVLKTDVSILDQADISFVYRPLWHVRSNALNSYLSTMMVDDGTLTRPYQSLVADDVEVGGQTPTHALADQLLLRKALVDIAALRRLGQNCRVVAPIHFSTLSSASARRTCVDMLKALSEDERKLLVVEIIYPFAAASSLPVVQAANLIKSFACAIFLKVKFDHLAFDGLKAGGILAVGVDLEGVWAPDIDLFKKYDAFCDAAAQAGLRSYIHGLNTRSKTTAAVCSGFDFVSGDTVGAPVGFPGGVRAFSVFDTYALERDS